MIRSVKRHKTPTMLQMEATECGAVALGIILGHYGLFLSQENLRIQCGVSRDGSNALNIIKAARHFGMQAHGIKGELEDFEAADFPLIAFWQFNHFVVIEGYTRDKVFINDPATGKRSVTREEFDEAYTGVVIYCQPGPDFKRQGTPFSLRKSFAARLQGERISVSFITILSLLLVVPGVLLSGMAKIYIDNILIGEKNTWIMPFLTALVLVFILQLLISAMQRHYLLRLRIKFILTASGKLVWHLLHLPLAFFQQRFAGDIYDRIAANDRIAQVLSVEVSSAIASLFSMFFFIMVVFLLSWQLALIGVFVEIIIIMLYFGMMRRIADKAILGAQNAGKLSGYQMAILQMIERIKTSSAESDVFNRWASYHADVLNNQRMMAHYHQFLQTGPQLLHALGTVSILMAGSLLVMQGTISIGTLVAVQLLLANFSAPVATLLNAGFDFQRVRADFLRIDDVLRQEENERAPVKDKPMILTGRIAIQALDFAYAPLDPLLLKQIDLTIRAGEKVAILGPSGCGKSTLSKLISGLYLPIHGSINFDDHALQTIPAAQLAKHLALVEQDIFLFSGSVRDNLGLWREAISDETMIEALHVVDMMDILIPRGGLDCMVQEAGVNFSQGQRQRLEIARALCGKPRLLLLDESTSGLSAQTESFILKQLFEQDMTVILITHRVSAIKHFDRIVMMDDGAITACGNHAELLEQSEQYKQLVGLDE